MTIYEILFNFFIYGFLGWCGEVAFAAVKEREFVNRGFLNGPICPIYGIGVTVVVVLLRPYMGNLFLLYAASVILTTLLEGVTGYALEKLFHHRWWDYSQMPFNIGGYVCLIFSLLWGGACLVIVHFVHPVIARLVFLIPVYVGMVLLAILSVILTADLCVTVKGIVKLNRELRRMEEIASELRSISDQIGENIYNNMMEGLELQDNLRQKADDLKEKAESDLKERAEELRERAENLKGKYRSLLETQSQMHRRLIKAFPGLRPRRYVREFDLVKKYIREKRHHGK